MALNTLALLKSEVVRATKEAGASGSIDDGLVERIVRKEVKRRLDAIEAYRKGGREEAARREEAEMAILRTYLPAAVMKAATARLAGRAEGAQVAAAARKLLAS